MAHPPPSATFSGGFVKDCVWAAQIVKLLQAAAVTALHTSFPIPAQEGGSMGGRKEPLAWVLVLARTSALWAICEGSGLSVIQTAPLCQRMSPRSCHGKLSENSYLDLHITSFW